VKLFLFDIQRYSIHDGPGIRTTVFLKGCNMRCKWCENPESISKLPQISFDPERCIGCKTCEKVCLHNAFTHSSGYPINKALCDACGICVSACPANALTLIGAWYDVDDLVAELIHDRDYWKNSGGGVTISGGEAALQVEALHNLLTILRGQHVHTVLQTNGNIPWQELEHFASEVSLIHFDIKGIDDIRHRENTGVGNGLILKNARRLSEGMYPVVFRVPLIPGYNDSPEDLVQLKDYLNLIEAHFVDILPYHNLGERKLALTGVEGGRLSLAPMSKIEAVEKARVLCGKGREVTVSGEKDPVTAG
jgi:glycyl-radical enzyme activating protein